MNDLVALSRTGVCTLEHLREAESRAHAIGVDIIEVLLQQGVESQRLYEAASEAWGIPLAELGGPLNPEIHRGLEVRDMCRLGAMPVRRAGGELTVASWHAPTPTMVAQLKERFSAREIHWTLAGELEIIEALAALHGQELGTRSSFELSERAPQHSARHGVAPWQRWTCIALGLLGALAFALEPQRGIQSLLLWVNLCFFIGISFKLVACVVGARKLAEAEDRSLRARLAGMETEERCGDAELPTYTVLVPAYKEANIIDKVVERLGSLDYPREKLQVLLLIEHDDHSTLEAARAALPPYAQIIEIPGIGPRTKPKACNYGLHFTRGDLVVIFDAEDAPEPLQLRDVVRAFGSAGNDVACVQARLNYHNSDENVLTRMFTLEYSFWFDYMLPGLDALRLPIPLGGTSNHFRTDLLWELGGWDPFNVTEDADLGVRAMTDGWRVEVIDSTTWEEACSEWRAWIRQRTRWIKGYMVTALVHLRRPRHFVRGSGIKEAIGLVGLIAGTPLTFLACPLVWGITLWSLLGGQLAGVELDQWVKDITFLNFIVGNGAMIALSGGAVARRRLWRLVPYALLNPFYWVLHSVAAWRALWQMLRSQHSSWEKTPHGIIHDPAVKYARQLPPDLAKAQS